MNWKDEARQRTTPPVSSLDNARAIGLMLDHWPEEGAGPKESAELFSAKKDLREAGQILIEEIGASGPERTVVTARRAAERLNNQRLVIKEAIKIRDALIGPNEDGWTSSDKSACLSTIAALRAENKNCQALSRGYDLLREATERARKALGANQFENVDHAAERVVKERNDLQAALAEQMAENRRLSRRIEGAKASLNKNP